MNDLVKNYVKNLNKQDIKNFALKEKVNITDKEVNILYDAIKNNTDILLSSKALMFIKSFKELLSPEVYNKILEKYNKYKNFIS